MIGLLMIRDENDILYDTLYVNTAYVDAFYVLDGSDDYKTAEEICQEFDNCAGYWRDGDLPVGYPAQTTDGCRQFLYDRAAEEHGYDEWFVLLHGDELWVNDPADAVELVPWADGFEFPLPFAFSRKWDYGRSAFEQLREFVFPGWPEFRMFRGGKKVYYKTVQHFLTRPYGLDGVVRMDDWPVLHFPYRSPESQALKRSKSANWSPENYSGGDVWDDRRLAELIRTNPHYEYVGVVSGL